MGCDGVVKVEDKDGVGLMNEESFGRSDVGKTMRQRLFNFSSCNRANLVEWDKEEGFCARTSHLMQGLSLDTYKKYHFKFKSYKQQTEKRDRVTSFAMRQLTEHPNTSK